MSRPLVRGAVTVLLLAPTAASAQALAGDSGLVTVSSADGGTLVRLGALAQLDGRWQTEGDPTAAVDPLTMRRLRPVLQGRFLRRFEFTVVPDFGRGTSSLLDAYVDARLSGGVRLRVGRAKTPFGDERLATAGTLLFAERGFPSAIAPNRDVGVQLLGELAGRRVGYAAALGNGAPDGTHVDFPARGTYAATGRVVLRPFAASTGTPLAGLTLSSAVSASNVIVLPDLRTSVIGTPFLSYEGASGDGTRVRTVQALGYSHRAFAGYAEYATSSQAIRRDEVRADVGHAAWQAAASFVLTGEEATDRGVRPRHALDVRHGHAGAIQLAVRYHAIRVSPRAVTLGLATPGSSPTAGALTLGANWYPAAMVKCAVDVERTSFDRAATHPAETGVVGRVQVSF